MPSETIRGGAIICRTNVGVHYLEHHSRSWLFEAEISERVRAYTCVNICLKG